MYIRVILQSNPKWDKLASSVSSEASQTLGFLRGNFESAPLKIRELAYCSMVRPQVEYRRFPKILMEIH